MRNTDLKSRFRLAALIPVTVILLAGCTLLPAGKPAAASKKPAFQVPGLTVVLDCGQCQVPSLIPSLIVAGYATAARKAGAGIAPNTEAVITVTSYSERSGMARVLAGGFAGKDEIRAVVRYREKNVPVEDYYRNSWLGIEDLAETIGEMAFEAVKYQPD